MQKEYEKKSCRNLLKMSFLDVSMKTELSILVFPPDWASQEPPWGCNPVWCPVLTIVWSSVSAKLERASDVQPGSKYRHYFKEPINSEMWMPLPLNQGTHTHTRTDTVSRYPSIRVTNWFSDQMCQIWNTFRFFPLTFWPEEVFVLKHCDITVTFSYDHLK